MKPAQKRYFSSLATAITVFSMLVNLLFPAISLLSASIALAQDEPVVTEPPATEPAPPPTEAATEPPPTEPTIDEPAVEPTIEQPTVEATPETPTTEPATEEPTVEPTIEPPTVEPTAEPTQPPALLTFKDDFQDGTADGWNFVTAGWQVASEEDNFFLSALTPNESISVANLALEHFALTTSVRVEAGSTASVVFRAGAENYTVTLNSNGMATLSRGAATLGVGPEAAPAPEGAPAIWRTLNITALGSTISVSVDGLLQFEATDPTPLTAGTIGFSTGAANTGAVAFDNVLITELEAPIIIPTVEPTVELTETVTPEVTETPVETPEATETPTAVVVLSDTFDGDLSAWMTADGLAIEQEADGNFVLRMAAGSSLLPANALYLADFQLDASVSLLDEGSLSLFFRTQEGSTYVLSIGGSSTVLSRNDGTGLVELARSDTPHALDTWHTVSLRAQGGQLAVMVDGALEIDFLDETPLASGQLAFVANGEIKLDNIAVTDFTPVDALAAPTMTPVGLTAENRLKMDGLLLAALEAYLSGGQSSAMTVAASNSVEVLDDSMRVGVVIWGAEGVSGLALVPGIEAVGGIVDYVGDYNIRAQVPLPALIALVNLAEVGVILLPDVAVPTGNLGAPAEEGLNTPAGAVFSEGFNILGANDWHTGAPAILGSGANIAVIDVDFNTSASAGSPVAADRACLTGGVINPGGYVGSVTTTGHGTRMVEVICDIAPSATVTGYLANDAASVANAVAAADNTNEIIVIGLDLGANISAGDGTSTGADTPVGTLYSNITTAKNAGVLVIAAAGNSAGRYSSFNYTGAAFTVTINASQGDIVNVSWDRWGVAGDISMSLGGAGFPPPNPINKPARGGAAPPSHRFTVPACTGTPNCTVTLTVSGGGASPAYVQVQVMDASGNNTAAITGSSIAADAAAGQLARPADSGNVLTVGAACARPGDHYRLTELSSRGPIFGGGGIAPVGTPDTRAEFKPDLVGPSDVSVSGTLMPLSNVGCDDFDGEGFNGTSAAAAHIAGMAALLLAVPTSTTNILTPYPMNDGNTADITLAERQAVIDYMQSHTLDLGDTPGGLFDAGRPDGFDRYYGAGLPVLGSPAPTSNIRPTVSAPAGACASPAGTTVYVNPANLNDTNLLVADGTIGDGYYNPATAIYAAATGANSCIVLAPGEYVTSFQVLGPTGGWGTVVGGLRLRSYDFTLGNLDANPPSVFWVNDSYNGASGGITNKGSDIDIEGFDFLAANPRPNSSFVAAAQPRALDLVDATGSAIRSNSFANFGSIGTLTGERPITIGGGQNIIIESNTFTNNDATGGAALRIEGSNSDEVGGLTINTSVLVLDNRFTTNASTGSTGASFDPVIFVRNSFARIHNNRFTTNSAEEIIRISNPVQGPNPNADNYEVQVAGNLFTNNTNNSPVIHLDPARRFRFINNTVVGHSAITEPTARYVILRGNASGTNGDGEWDIINNIFYNNASATLGLIADPTGDFTCDSVGGGVDDIGARANWYFNSGPINQDCVNSLTNTVGTEGNISSDPTAFFVGGLSLTDPYQLLTGAPGVDAGENGPAGILSSDLLGNGRITDGGGGAFVDLGVYELAPLTAEDVPNVPVTEDAASAGIPFDATGGFPPYTFEIQTFPANFNTAVGASNPCNGQPVFFNGTVWLYCPPPNFYTVGAPAGAPANVTLTYKVRDASNVLSASTGTVTINISPTDDPMAGLNPNQSVLAEADGPFSFRVRPYVRFNNFRFSEPSTDTDLNPTNGIQSTGADYGYTYSACTIVPTPGSNEAVIAGAPGTLCAAINGAGGSASVVNLNASTTVGFVDYTYTVTDSLNGGVATLLEGRITVVGDLPDAGLHDDTSFAFNYQGNWSPIYSEPNINNTLHRTATLNSYADFGFVGTGFTLYMQGYSAGGNWEMQIVEADDTITTFPWNGAKSVTSNGITCVTSQTTTGNFISNRTTLPYTVSCTGLLDDEIHFVRVLNRAALQLNVDAVGILEDDVIAFQPGFHDVNEPIVSPLFAGGWTQLNLAAASGGIAMFTNNELVPDITFRFQGTGFAIGTVLERTTTFLGAQYDICVAPLSAPANETCQHFDNTLGATTATTWNIYRPFYGFNPNVEHIVRIHITNIDAGRRMVIDSIVVFDQRLTDNVELGTTEDDQVGLMVFGGGLTDSWTINFNHTTASNRSLTSIVSTVPKAGPFVSFQIPDTADTINWFRLLSTADSQNMLICVDRALGIASGGFGNCIKVDVRTGVYQIQDAVDGSFDPGGTLPINNPIMIRESDFRGGSWGAGSGGLHTVEIFSLTNQPFNMDKVQVIDSDNSGADELLAAGYYEEYVTGIRWFTENTGTYTPLLVGDDGNFANLTQTSASGGKVKTINANIGGTGNGLNEGYFFQFTGTGFSLYFTMDTKADAVQACWDNQTFGTITGANINTIFTTGTCQTWDNQNAAIRYQAARSVLGLPSDDYTVVVRMLPDQGQPTNHIVSHTPITMNVDAVEIYNTPLPGNILNTTGLRYETSYVNRVTEGRFAYYRTVWTSVSTTAANAYSGRNYDTITNKIGAGVVFQTTGANRVILYRRIAAGFTRLEICATRVSDGNRQCTIYDNAGGAAYQAVLNIPLLDATAHVVSIVTFDAGAFYLDAIELTNSAVLQPGLHQETHPGITYSESNDVPPHTLPTVCDVAPEPACPVAADWRNVVVTSYNGGRAMQSSAVAARVTFQFTGTGFSLITLFDTSSATEVDVNVTGPFGVTETFSLNRAATTYSSSYSLTGLFPGTYTVTLTESDPLTKHRMTVDAIEVYGSYDAARAMPVGFYDNAATNTNGDTFLSFAPSNSAWTATTGVAGYLNQSRHFANRYGANVTFQVQNADSITLFDKLSTTTALRVCWVPTAGGARTCQTVNTVTEGMTPPAAIPDTNLNDIQTVDFVTTGNYNVSVTNLGHAQSFYLDGIGVQDTNTLGLTEGIYHQDHPELLCTNGTIFNNAWTIVAEATATDGFVCSTGTGDTDFMEFTVTGTGFSILLSESTLTSTNYTLTVTTVGDVTGDVVLAPPTSTAKKLVALTYVGLASGPTYTVRLTNNSTTLPLLVDRVDILGPLTASEQIGTAVVGNIENTDRRIVYLPFGRQTLTASTLASGGSQSFLAMQGSVVYFELPAFGGQSFDYVRQISTAYGLVDICVDLFGTPLAEPCDDPGVSNALGTSGYQIAENVAVPGGNNWVAIRNLDGKSMPLDFIRVADTGVALTAGYYEAGVTSHPELDFGSGAFLPVTNASASGGSTQSTINVGDEMLFEFTGTGFSVFFTMDAKADAIEICWSNSLGGTALTLIPGGGGVTCQSYDNQSTTTRYRAARTILGLQSGAHTVAVRMLADNGLPALHTAATTLPITMQIDAVQIYDQNYTALLTSQLNTVGTLYQNSFTNAAANNQFLYFGSGWSTLNSTLYSGGSYDRNLNVFGAGVVFRTSGADGVVIYRDTSAAYPPLEVCAIRESTNARRCVTVPNNGGTGRTQPFGVLLNTTNLTDPHIVTITTLGVGTFNLDAVEVVNTTAPLVEGMYEEYHPALLYSQDPVTNFANVTSDWTPIHSTTYSGGRMMQTTALPAVIADPADNNGLMVFEFDGTGFEIGTLVDRYGGEVLVCYEGGGIPANPWDIDQFCYRYQNESSVTRATVSRSVAGLGFGTYSVRIQNVSDPFSNLTATPVARLAAYATARLRVDYVRIFDEPQVTVTAAGWYNENATDGSGNQFLQLLPALRWSRITGTAAAAYSNGSYYTVIATSPTVASNVYAGPLATLRVQVPAAGATVILYTYTAVSTNSDQILVCADNVTDDLPPPPNNECVVKNIRTANQIVVSSTDLAALGVTGTVDLTFRALTTGYFKIDGFQVIHGTTLAPGIYDSVLASTGGVINTNVTFATLNTASAFNGSMVRTNVLNNRANFTFDGTGFSVITHYDVYAADMRICYVQGAPFDGTFDSANETCEFIGAVASFTGTNPSPLTITMSGISIDTSNAVVRGVIANNARVRILTTFSGGNEVASEVTVIPTTSAYRYGFSYYGLPSNTYGVEVRHIDTPSTTAYYLRIDAIAVFGDAPTVMNAGLYDDAVATITFAPQPFWTVVTNAVYNPPRGPYNHTEHTAIYNGTIAQLNVNGNGFILYQTASTTGSRTVRICLVVPTLSNECSDFSQNVATRYFTPIAFFGFGSGAHEVIIENRQHGTSNRMSIDAVRVLP